MNRIKRFNESNITSKFDKDIEDVLSKLQFIGDYEKLTSGYDNEPYEYWYANEDYEIYSYTHMQKYSDGYKEIHKGVVFRINIDSYTECENEELPQFIETTNYYIEMARILKETKEVIELYQDDYVFNGFCINEDEYLIDFQMISKEIEKSI